MRTDAPFRHRRLSVATFRPIKPVLRDRGTSENTKDRTPTLSIPDGISPHSHRRGGPFLFSVKICGITQNNDARIAVAAGADAIGLNFYAASPRYLAPNRAAQIAAELPTSVCKVGVFVNTPPATVASIVRQVGLDMAQLHGDEPPEWIRQLAPLPVVRAFRQKDLGLGPVHEYLQRCDQMGCLPQAVLIDAYQPGQYGGTGKVVDWNSIRARPFLPKTIPLILAGGLGPDNVMEAIETANPDAVDTASGVEEGPGVKSEKLVSAFVSAARRGLNHRASRS